MHFSGSHTVFIIAGLQAAVASYASGLKQQDYYDDNDKRAGRVYLSLNPVGDNQNATINMEIGCQYGRWGQPPSTRTVWVNFPQQDDGAKFHTFFVSFMTSSDTKANPIDVEIEYPAIEFMTDSTIAAAQYLGKRLGELICEFLDTGSFEPADVRKLSKR